MKLMRLLARVINFAFLTMAFPFGAALLGEEAVDLWWNSRPWK